MRLATSIWHNKNIKEEGGKELNLHRRMEKKYKQKKKDYCIYEAFFCMNLMATRKIEI